MKSCEALTLLEADFPEEETLCCQLMPRAQSCAWSACSKTQKPETFLKRFAKVLRVSAENLPMGCKGGWSPVCEGVPQITTTIIPDAHRLDVNLKSNTFGFVPC